MWFSLSFVEARLASKPAPGPFQREPRTVAQRPSCSMISNPKERIRETQQCKTPAIIRSRSVMSFNRFRNLLELTPPTRTIPGHYFAARPRPFCDPAARPAFAFRGTGLRGWQKCHARAQCSVGNILAVLYRFIPCSVPRHAQAIVPSNLHDSAAARRNAANPPRR